MEEDEEDNFIEAKAKQEVTEEIVYIDNEGKENQCNKERIHETKNFFVDHQHCVSLS